MVLALVAPWQIGNGSLFSVVSPPAPQNGLNITKTSVRSGSIINILTYPDQNRNLMQFGDIWWVHQFADTPTPAIKIARGIGAIPGDVAGHSSGIDCSTDPSKGGAKG